MCKITPRIKLTKINKAKNSMRIGIANFSSINAHEQTLLMKFSCFVIWFLIQILTNQKHLQNDFALNFKHAVY
jgi:hypothetical protein